MSTTRLARGASAFVLAIGCTGLDPDAFGARVAPPKGPEQAGWSFDAGALPDTGGYGSTTSTDRAGSGGASRPGGGRYGEGGDGAADEGGAAGTPDDGAAANGSAGGGGSSSGRAGAGGTRAGGAGGMRTSGGVAGAAGRAGGGRPAAGGAAGGGRGGAPASHALFFSEYVEGSSSYKALEIQAREESTLAGCRLVTFFNGSSSGTGLALDGSLAKGSVTTLCSTALAALVGEPCARATNLTFNGDDAIGLECAGATLDVIGTIGADPGDAWSSKGGSTLNQTLRRRCDEGAGDPDGSDAFDPANEWTAYPVDTFDGLGVAECSQH